MRSTARGLGWLAGQVFVVLMPTQITPVKKQRKKHALSMLHLYVTVVACFLSLCTLWSVCVIVYTLVLLHRFVFFYLIQNYLFAMYMLIYNRAVSFHLLLPSVWDWVLRPRNTSVKPQSQSVSQVLVHRWLLAKGKHLLVHIFVSCVLFTFVFVIKSLLVCYCACSSSLKIFAFKEIIYRN